MCTYRPTTWCSCRERKTQTTPRKDPLQAPEVVKAEPAPPQEAAAVIQCPFIQVSTNPIPTNLFRTACREGSSLCCFGCQRTQLSIPITKDDKWSYQCVSKPLANLSAVTHLGSPESKIIVQRKCQKWHSISFSTVGIVSAN